MTFPLNKPRKCVNIPYLLYPFYFFLNFITFILFYFNRSVFLFNVGLKSMVEQGVRNPLVDLLSLEDKTLDEVRFNESLM